ncbi:MAG: hypothetical protein N7Q72_06335, partial [Spiroplasma sp. Tabriz.8]|nr:hypothetical protein [Spiroplasma sp. Tabriz.8]
ALAVFKTPKMLPDFLFTDMINVSLIYFLYYYYYYYLFLFLLLFFFCLNNVVDSSNFHVIITLVA